MNDTTPSEMFLQAVENFPFPYMHPTGYEHGDLLADEDGDVEYCREFTFDGGRLGTKRIAGCGWEKSISRTTLSKLPQVYSSLYQMTGRMGCCCPMVSGSKAGMTSIRGGGCWKLGHTERDKAQHQPYSRLVLCMGFHSLLQYG
jgi:hypothetical protein